MELKDRNLIVQTADSPTTYIPAKDLELISLKEIIDTSRINEKSERFINQTDIDFVDVDSVIESMDDSIYKTLENRNLKDLVN